METEPQSLLFDADDTLWENAVFFHEALADFLRLMREHGVAEDEAHAVFNELETRGFRRRWFGGRRLEINLRAAARRMLDESRPEIEAEIVRLGQMVRGHEIRLFDGVHPVLEGLEGKHRLFLVTMGEGGEQVGKIERSGLAPLFESIHVLRDKTRGAYEEILRSHRLHRRSTWMIGNSLVKDIKPARAAGLKTVYLANGQDFGFGLPDDGIEPDLVVPDFVELGRAFGLRP